MIIPCGWKEPPQRFDRVNQPDGSLKRGPVVEVACGACGMKFSTFKCAGARWCKACTSELKRARARFRMLLARGSKKVKKGRKLVEFTRLPPELVEKCRLIEVENARKASVR